MKTQLISISLALSALIASSVSYATDYYCELNNVPAVKKALEQALKESHADRDGAKPTGKIITVPVSGMGDAFDFWGTDLLVYPLDGLAGDSRRSVAVKVNYTAFLAKDSVDSNESDEKYTCVDTGAVNAELIYSDVTASPVTL